MFHRPLTGVAAVGTRQPERHERGVACVRPRHRMSVPSPDEPMVVTLSAQLSWSVPLAVGLSAMRITMADRTLHGNRNPAEAPVISIGHCSRVANRKAVVADRISSACLLTRTGWRTAGNASRTEIMGAPNALSMRDHKRVKSRWLRKGQHAVVVHENPGEGLVVVHQNRSG